MSSEDETKWQAEKKHTSNGDSASRTGYESHLDKPVHAPRLPTLRKGFRVCYPSRFLNINSLFLAVCAVSSFLIGNFRRHGFLINPLVWVDNLKVDGEISLIPLAFIIPWLLFPIVTLQIEKGLASGKLSDFFGRIAHIIWINVIFIYPIAVVAIYGRPMIFAAGFPLFIAYSGLILKTWSFAETNHWYRHKWLSRQNASQSRKDALKVPKNKEHEQTSDNFSEPQIQYPANLTIKKLMYFLFLPTFCYQLSYPSTGPRNYAAIAWRLAEFLLSTVVMFASLQQWVSPTLQYLLPPYAKGHTWVLLERLLATIVAENFLWLVFFFFLFHTYCALLAEILCFADHKYYEDWWQAETLDTFWKKWNLPVHYWAIRHVYIPLIQRGYSKRFARGAVFVFSGALHEYFCSGPLRIVRGHFLILFCLQAFIFDDLTDLVSKKFGREVGISVTGLLVVLICLLPLLYMHDVILTYSGVEELETYPYY